MKFEWLNYLHLAERLYDEAKNSTNQQDNDSSNQEASTTGSQTVNNECKMRCSISRSYYSAFCLSRNYLRDVENDRDLKANRGVSVHQHVIETLKSHQNPECRTIGIRLERLRQLRNQADYEDVVAQGILASNAKMALKSTQEAIRRLQVVSPSI